jgi:predicted DCC family thiol-disulfide oxidoreductase YuxK
MNPRLSESGGNGVRGEPRAAGDIVLFDGVCNLCNGAVRFIVARDPDARYRFAALDSDAARAVLRQIGVRTTLPDSIVLVDNTGVSSRSTAALRIARRLTFPWPLLYVFMLVPRPLRDAVYDFVARNRYRWFGRQELCLVPTPDLRGRFLE